MLFSNGSVRPSQLPGDSNYYLSRDHHYPMWEAFPNGGAWNIKLDKRGDVMDRMWEELFLATIGEAFGEPDVVAIVLAIRSQRNFLSVWNADNMNHAVRFQISETLRALFSIRGVTDSLEYKSHATSMKDGSTFRNAMTYQSVVTQEPAAKKNPTEAAKAAGTKPPPNSPAKVAKGSAKA
ncbi:uncharacterized protein AMSG_07207 [Thecamonas trahens ATCC 50062]|uniref:Uncharacterized protein n=1 Tax=Thecamonas trahens ATCC 50062 TaxID=461836 RepID=A0A0L0DF97_THETB|nr:hypothetical protein AMSG_07207 [Thecamonas trahens ATCC 50062]KNC50954.1 hypothetical protein AMSG_07207 [Thecamonas trahens ATCC 50062]|eukprot:XP_013756650.1 hypothetical protein AMSG_07207 [Thecamonas trahens ATCC 50062]